MTLIISQAPQLDKWQVRIRKELPVLPMKICFPSALLSLNSDLGTKAVVKQITATGTTNGNGELSLASLNLPCDTKKIIELMSTSNNLLFLRQNYNVYVCFNPSMVSQTNKQVSVYVTYYE